MRGDWHENEKEWMHSALPANALRHDVIVERHMRPLSGSIGESAADCSGCGAKPPPKNGYYRMLGLAQFCLGAAVPSATKKTLINDPARWWSLGRLLFFSPHAYSRVSNTFAGGVYRPC